MRKSISLINSDTWRKALCVLCILGCSLTVFAQKQVSGKVVDVDGIAVVGASVSEKGTTNGVVTDSKGEFNISVQNDNAVLQISYIGYVTQDITVGVQTTLNVTLVDAAQDLDEVVVVGYGTQKKVNLSGAIATISAKGLENRPVTNANLALQGLAPGMNIQMSDGHALSAPDINIRGFTSINGGSAFILVDNVPVTAAELSRINPSDIESASVLKDASSAAIYGARAAFGVVLITTKTAKSEKLTVDFDANYGLRSFMDFPTISTNLYEYMVAQAVFADNPARFTDEQLAYAKRRMEDLSLPEVLHPDDALNPSNKAQGRWEYYAISDWADILLKNYSPVQNYNVRVAQKGEKLSYAVSGGLYQQNGMMKYNNDVLTRYNVRGNGVYKMTKWWELGSNISFTRSNFERSSLLDNSWNFLRVQQDYLYLPMYTPEGFFEDAWIAQLVKGGKSVMGLNETQASFNTTINLFKDVWTIKADANFRFLNESNSSTELSYQTSRGPGQLVTSGNRNTSMTNRADLYNVYNIYTDFHKTFAEKHFVLAMAGFNQEYFHGENLNVRADNLLTDALPTIQLSGTNSTISKGHGITTRALRGFFARLNYIYDGKYIIEMNGRYDGTSRYRKEDRFGFFPSGSAAWVVSNESFMQNLKESLRLSNLKLRGSYGVLGNQMMKDSNGNEIFYPYIPTMGVTSVISPLIDGNRPLAVTQPGVVSDNLTWETVRTINGGIDLSLFNGKFDFSFDKFVRYTEDMLTKSKTLPAIFGATEPRANAADLKTKGWELSVGWRDEFNLLDSPFSYSVRFMLADSRTWITRYDNPDKRIDDYYEGQEIGEVWGYETLGYFASDEEAAGWADQSATGNGRPFLAGDLKFKDVNNDRYINQGSNTVNDPGDRKIIGNSSYRLPYSIDLGVEWKGFDLRVFLQGIGKRQAYPPSGSEGVFFWGFYNHYVGSMLEKNLDNWNKKGDAGYYPRMKPNVAASGELAKPQTKYLQDASFMRLKNLTLGYTLPNELTSKVKINRLRVYVTGENLLTFHHIEVPGNDPERFNNIYYPFMKVVSFGLNLNF
jgi:TonB-linked SusC/RagA family outer membrane protein